MKVHEIKEAGHDQGGIYLLRARDQTRREFLDFKTLPFT